MTWFQYLGCIVDEDSVHAKLTKIQAICDWLAPTTLTKLRSFLGLASFYRRFVLGFSHIASPLNQVTKGGSKAKFMWAKSRQQAFEKLKHRLWSTSVLSLPNLQQHFENETDASKYLVGVVLSHSTQTSYGISQWDPLKCST